MRVDVQDRLTALREQVGETATDLVAIGPPEILSSPSRDLHVAKG